MTRPQGAYCFSGDCSRTPTGMRMLISNNVLSKWNVALSLLSCSSAVSLTAFQPSHPPLMVDVVPWAAPVSHYCHWWFSNRLLSPLAIVLSLFSLPLATANIHFPLKAWPALTSSPCSIHCMPFTWSLQLYFSWHFCHYRLSTSVVWGLI